MTFTTNELDAALRADARVVRFRYEIFEPTGESKGYLAGVRTDDGVLNYNYLAEIKRTGNITIDLIEDVPDGWINADQVDYLEDQIQIWFELKMPDGTWNPWSLGFYIMNSGDRQFVDGNVRRTVDLYDRLLVPRQRKAYRRWFYDIGANPINEVQLLLDTAMNMAYDIPDVAKTLTARLEWDAGVTNLVIINGLLDSVNYGSLFADVDGVLKSFQYILPEDREIDIEYLMDDFSVISEEMLDTFELFDVPNHFVMTVSQPDQPEVTAGWSNNDPRSPTSIPNRGGIVITLYRSNTDAVDAATLQDRVIQMAAEFSKAVSSIDFTTANMPNHGEASAIWLEHPGLDIKGLYIEEEWKMELKPGGRMTHKARRMVPITGS